MVLHVTYQTRHIASHIQLIDHLALEVLHHLDIEMDHMSVNLSFEAILYVINLLIRLFSLWLLCNIWYSMKLCFRILLFTDCRKDTSSIILEDGE